MKTIAAEVRLAEPGDASSLATLHAAAWRGAYTGIIPYRALSAMIERRGPSWWQRALDSRATILLLEFGGEAAGYATLGRNRTKALPAEGEIFEIYLRPQFQGIGFGRRLFDSSRALLRTRGLRGAAVWALSDNTNAMAFYEAVGGREIAGGSESFDGVALRKTAFHFV